MTDPTHVPERLEPVDRRITGWMARNGVLLTRLALGLVFTWFGVLKFLPGGGPAADLATRTIVKLTNGHVSAEQGLVILAGWETLIGLGLLSGRLLRITLLLLFLQMGGTLLPLVYFPAETFERFPFVPTLEGQYIIKNVVLIAAAIVVGATVRGGGLRGTGLPGARK
ncbi:MAG TPA: hypothetical protein VFF36_06350 [Planctomycetota bacterium]|nr:hypothetical protein [Planctomycetota bacterium]